MNFYTGLRDVLMGYFHISRGLLKRATKIAKDKAPPNKLLGGVRIYAFMALSLLIIGMLLLVTAIVFTVFRFPWTLSWTWMLIAGSIISTLSFFAMIGGAGEGFALAVLGVQLAKNLAIDSQISLASQAWKKIEHLFNKTAEAVKAASKSIVLLIPGKQTEEIEAIWGKAEKLIPPTGEQIFQKTSKTLEELAEKAKKYAENVRKQFFMYIGFAVVFLFLNIYWLVGFGTAIEGSPYKNPVVIFTVVYLLFIAVGGIVFPPSTFGKINKRLIVWLNLVFLLVTIVFWVLGDNIKQEVKTVEAKGNYNVVAGELKQARIIAETGVINDFLEENWFTALYDTIGLWATGDPMDSSFTVISTNPIDSLKFGVRLTRNEIWRVEDDSCYTSDGVRLYRVAKGDGSQTRRCFGKPDWFTRITAEHRERQLSQALLGKEEKESVQITQASFEPEQKNRVSRPTALATIDVRQYFGAEGWKATSGGNRAGQPGWNGTRNSTNEIWCPGTGSINYTFNLTDVPTDTTVLTFVASSELQPMALDLNNMNLSSDVLLEINNGKYREDFNVIPDNGHGKRITIKVPPSAFQTGVNHLTFNVGLGTLDNGLVLYTREPIKIRTV